MKLFIIEDEIKLALSLKRGLEQQGFAVDVTHDGQEALDQIEINHEEYDLIILDNRLPSKNGFEICAAIRKQHITTPIIMLTASDSLSDTVIGLNTGADDYISKPYSFSELLARIRSLLRRPKGVCMSELTFGEVSLNPAARTVSVCNKHVHLTSKEFAIVEYLMRNAGVTVSRETILSHVWDQAFDSFSNVVDVHITNIKKKIDLSKHETHIQTIRGSGYRFNK